ncbi:hypothetical protein [Moorena sp. SIO3I6]|uniref:hypothetical protein n=1 Tax=Moorena sp. SIO3I6 TaxID=2607831 RepID=UPI0025DBFA6B|nr:hypothetical protein [Moorena sp. SIO3I6]
MGILPVINIFSRFLYTSRFPIPDSPLPFLNRKPQLDSWGFSEGIKFVKKVSRRARGRCRTR